MVHRVIIYTDTGHIRYQDYDNTFLSKQAEQDVGAEHRGRPYRCYRIAVYSNFTRFLQIYVIAAKLPAFTRSIRRGIHRAGRAREGLVLPAAFEFWQCVKRRRAERCLVIPLECLLRPSVFLD